MSPDVAPTDALALAERAILSIKEVVCQYTALLYPLYAKRNALLPVSRLPLEILTTIFIHGARDYYESDYGGDFTPQIPSWVNVSYVCTHWRSIALNCPTLWTYHFNVSLRWTKELMLRSRDAPLKISCLYPYDQDDEFSQWLTDLLEEVLKHSERIQELSLRVPPWFLPAKLLLCVPRIEKLDISFQLDELDHSIAITDGCKNTLYFLQLTNCSLPWHLLNLSRLDALFLHRVRTPSPLDMLRFLAVLSGMQNLTVLHLYHVLPNARDFLCSGGPGNSSGIDLPYLTSLAIAEPLSKLVAFLSCVNIPPRAALNLEPGFESGSSLDAFAPISSFLAQRFSPQLSCPIFRSLLLRAGSYVSLTFSLKCEPPLPGEVGDDIPLKITLMAMDEDTEETVLTESDTDRIICDIFSSLPLTNIRGLHIIHLRQFPSDFWREILGHLDGLRYMNMSYGRMPDLSLLSLVDCKSNENPDSQPILDQDTTSHHMFVPALEQLKLHCITFTPDHVSWSGGMSQRSLLDAVSTRERLRGRLIMTDCRRLDE